MVKDADEEGSLVGLEEGLIELIEVTEEVVLGTGVLVTEVVEVGTGFGELGVGNEVGELGVANGLGELGDIAWLGELGDIA